MTSRLRLLRSTAPVAALLACSALAVPAQAVSSPDGPPVPYSQPGDFRPSSALLAVGDIDGNGIKDVLETRELASSEGRARDVGIIARDGRRGVELWRRTVHLESYEGLRLTPLRRAGSNRPAVVVTIEGGRFVDGKVQQTRRLLGLDLRTNTFAWRTSFPGVSFAGEEGSQRCAPCHLPVGLLPARSGPGQDVLLAVVRSRPAQTAPPAYPGGPEERTPPADVQLSRLETATGKVLTIGAGFTTDQPEPQPELTPDLDGDRIDDVLLRGDTGRMITAVSTATGAVLWRSERLPFRAAISRSAPDADGRRDLIVPTYEGEQVDDYNERPVHTEPQIALLDSTTGQVRWRRAGTFAQPVSSTGGLPVVAVLDFTLQRGSTTTSTATTTAVDRNGLPRWRAQHELSTSRPGSELNAFALGDLQDAGDGDRDGQRDLLLTHLLEEGSNARQRVSIVIDGATGATSSALSGLVQPLLAPLQGAAPDLVANSKTSTQSVVLSGLDGAAGAVQWRRALPATAGSNVRASAVDAVRLYATGCHSLLVTSYPRTVHTVVRGDGVLAWTVVPSTSSLFGTQLIPGTASNGTC